MADLVARNASANRAWLLAFTLLFALVLAAPGAAVLSDPDTQWHIAIGRSILATGSFPTTDTLSYTFAGKPWIAKEWLSQIAYASAYQAGGWMLVTTLAVAASALAIYIVMLPNAEGPSPWTALAAGLVALLIVAPTVLARPHVLAFPLIAIWTLALMRGAASGRPPWWALLVMVLWANIHAGFTMGFVIAGAFGIEALLRAPAESRITTGLHWLAFGIATIIASAITPYGADALMLTFTMVSGNEAMQYIGEWRAFDLSATNVASVAFIAVLLGVLALDWRKNLGRMLLIAFLVYAMFTHVRFAMVFGLVAPMIGFAPVAAFVRRMADERGLFQDLAAPAPRMAFIAASIAALGLAALLTARPLMPPKEVAPNAALAAVPAELRQQPVFNSYNLGGFLAFNNVPTFIDGRSDQLFLGGFMSEVVKASTSKTPETLNILIERHNIRWAIVNSDISAATVFATLPGWREITSADAPSARVFVREMPVSTAQNAGDVPPLRR